MNPNPSPPVAPTGRFQFRILDYYVLLGFIALWMWFFSFDMNVKRPQTVLQYLPYPVVAWGLAILLKNSKLREGPKRILRLSLWGSLFSIPILFMAIPNLSTPRKATNGWAAIGACKTYASAQDTFRRIDYDNNGVFEYATNLKQLYGNGAINLIDKSFAGAEWGPTAKPKAGYFFKILKSQDPGAPGGRRSYFDVKGHMTVGYALLAFPAEYDESGFYCFLISNAGAVYQKDLGPDTSSKVLTIRTFDPTGWTPAE